MDFTYAALRYFNVAGADPRGRTGESTRNSTHLVKIACETALGKRPGMTIFGDDYPTPDGTCIRDYIHVTDLAAAHGDALRHLRAGRGNIVANCGYGRGFSVLEVIDTVRRVSGRDFPVAIGARRPGDPAAIVASPALIIERLGWQPRYADLEGIVDERAPVGRGLVATESSLVPRRSDEFANSLTITPAESGRRRGLRCPSRPMLW